jgi:subtilase family serine protease
MQSRITNKIIKSYFLKNEKRLIFIALLIITVVSVTLKPNYVDASTQSNNHIGQFALKPIPNHKVRDVCNTTVKPNQARCMAEISLNSKDQPLTGTPASSGSYGPVQFHTAYNLPCTPGGPVLSVCSTPNSFGPETIALIEAGNFSSGTSGLDSSLATYDSYYNLPSCTLSNGCLDVVNQSGTTSPLPSDEGWSDEMALDVEVAHMICQTCQILVVEANNNTTASLAAANETASTFSPASISNSWGSTVDDSEYDSDFEHSGIAEVAATGDSGSVSSGAAWPSDIPDVVGVAGTTLQLAENNSWASETVWDDSGGGCSNYYSAPTWQTSLSDWSTNGCGIYKSFGDVSADGDPNTGAAIYISSAWYQYGGTSLSAPIIASIFALDGSLPSGAVGASVPYASYTDSNMHNITSGNDCTYDGETHCTANVGFNTPSGLGSPNGTSAFTTLPTQPTNLTADNISQSEIDLSWTASSSGNSISDYYVYRDGSKIATVTSPSYDNTGLTPNTTYTYYIVAVDSFGNNSLASSTVSQFSAYPADINQDSHINLLDLSILASEYGQSGPSVGRADINRDGTVNLLDLSILASQYNSE